MTSEETVAETRADRFKRGIKTLDSISGDGAGQSFIDSLADISPELGHQVVAWAFGDIIHRPALAPRDRELVTLGVLTALGGCEPELEAHVNNALNVGLTPQDIVETLLHSAIYCGIPRAINATFVARKVFAERQLLPVRTI
ncbi:MAG TPA: carboxymuconolactone decarboxylase family protein [Acidimicrobiales bacterium]|nr:carboxymuconolactone decarboxylase family protein [Acidimicrobiales bacterium]